LSWALYSQCVSILSFHSHLWLLIAGHPTVFFIAMMFKYGCFIVFLVILSVGLYVNFKLSGNARGVQEEEVDVGDETVDPDDMMKKLRIAGLI
jgi:uncharacterized membrane protein